MKRILAILWLAISIGPILINFLVFPNIPKDYYIESINEETGEISVIDYNDLQSYPLYGLCAYGLGIVLGVIGNMLVHAGEPKTIFKVWFYIAENEVGDYETIENTGLRTFGSILKFFSFCSKVIPLLFLIMTFSIL